MTEYKPKIGIFQCMDRRELQLLDMTLARIHIDRVIGFTSSGEGVMHDIISGTGDCQHAVFRVDAEPFDVDFGVFPYLPISPVFRKTCRATYPSINVRPKLLVDFGF